MQHEQTIGEYKKISLVYNFEAIHISKQDFFKSLPNEFS